MQTIMVAIDLSERSDRALRRACLLAREHGAALILLHIISDHHAAWHAEELQTKAAAALEGLTQTLQTIDGVPCKVRTDIAPEVAGIVEAARTERPDLLVIGPRSPRRFSELFSGSTAEEVIRTIPCPVLMANALPLGPYRHIMQATDLSDVSVSALKEFAALGINTAPGSTILHIFDAPGAMVTGAFSPAKAEMDHYLEKEKSAAHQTLTALVRAARLSANEVITHPLETNFAHQILAIAAQEAADLLVISTRGRSGIAKALLGSVAARILATADIDVLTMPPIRN
jgi:nucleotide-binding universal stress UspA family protein